MSENAADSTALVIGGASGIGWATAKALAAEGHRVTIADLNGAAPTPAPRSSAHHTGSVRRRRRRGLGRRAFERWDRWTSS